MNKYNTNGHLFKKPLLSRNLIFLRSSFFLNSYSHNFHTLQTSSICSYNRQTLFFRKRLIRKFLSNSPGDKQIMITSFSGSQSLCFSRTLARSWTPYCFQDICRGLILFPIRFHIELESNRNAGTVNRIQPLLDKFFFVRIFPEVKK